MFRTAVIVMALAVIVPAQAPRRLPDFDRRTPVVIAVENVGPAVVNIRAQSRVDRFHMYRGLFRVPAEEDPETGQMYANRSLGSGVVIHPDGLVLTNEHVIHGADRVLLKFQDGREAPASLVNASTDSDLALLKIEAEGPFPTAVLGDSDHLMVGETTIALGNPFGLSSSATTGILSAIGRSVHFQNRTVFEDFLQTSALINPGNSGGPLLDINGRVIGINVAIDSRGQGIGFAIPINRAKEVVTDLASPELTRSAWVGFEPVVVQDRLTVANLIEQGPAARAGLREGDVILSVDEQPVRSAFDFNVALLRHRPEQEVEICVDRGGHRQVCEVLFEPLPLSAMSGPVTRLLGMECADLTPALANRLNLPPRASGPVVLSVDRSSSAHEIGLRQGDIILQVENYAVRNANQLGQALRMLRNRRRDAARIKVYRENEGVLQGTLPF